MINNVQIRNFKSIRELDFPCKRINVFVGKPNVGKSNVLEALSLYGAGYSNDGLLKPFIRMNFVHDLFYRKDTKHPIYVNSDIGALNLSSFERDTYFLMIDPLKKLSKANYAAPYANLIENRNKFFKEYEEVQIKNFEPTPFFISFSNDTRGNQNSIPFYSPVKKYSFQGFPDGKNSVFLGPSLAPPYGNNIVTVLYSERELLNFFAEIFKSEYDLELVVRSQENILEIQIREGMYTNALPMNLMSDTLQRLMFYLTAIRSNTDSILLFEEPETSFPTYTRLLGDNIARSINNQFFITTHSPYLLRALLDSTPIDEISIFVANYENHETNLHLLSSEEISELLEYDIDLFANFKKYVS